MDNLQPEMTETQKLFVSVSKQADALADLKETVEHDHKLLVEGNGDIPLVEKVRKLEDYMNGIKFWTRTVAVAIVLQTIAFGTTAIVHFIRLFPILPNLSTHIDIINQ